MSLFVDFGYTSLNHFGEELCGDKVEYAKNGDYVTLVLADGLGSGVKANILSTLTSKILCTMVSNNVSITECLETMVASLPVCKERGLAYSTFTVVHLNHSGDGFLFEFDNPQAIYIHDGKCLDLNRKKLLISGKEVYQSELKLKDNDYIVTMSDGAIHAGIGATLNFGWEREDIKKYLESIYDSKLSAKAMATQLAKSCNDLYLDKPGDDTTIAAIKIRKSLNVHIMVGPPVEKEKDDYYVARFLDGADKTIVCGGTSSTIVARYLKKPIEVDLNYLEADVPPTGKIEGIDLVTEGVLTLRRLLELSEQYLSIVDLTPKIFIRQDGATRLADLLFVQASDVVFFVGQSINAAHQGLPIDITMKLKLVESLANNLKKMGKNVIVNYD